MHQSSILPGRRFVDPNVVVSHFHIRKGDVVADFGAGSGFFVEALAQHVGSEGKIFACEIQRELVEKIGALVRSKGLFMVEPLWCDFETPGGSKLADKSVDCAIMVNTLFQIDDQKTAIHEEERTVRPGGKFFLIDWSESFGGLGPHPDQVITQHQAQALIESSGFVFERTFDAGDHHYGLAFRKI